MTRYMGDSNAVQSTRWRAQVRSSKTIKIRQLSMSVSIMGDWYKSFFSSLFIIWFFNILPSMFSHEVNQIFLIFRPSTGTTGGLCGWKCQSLGSNHFGPVGCQKQHDLRRGRWRGLSDAQSCSNYFQVSNLTTCWRNNNHKSEIWGRNQISFSQQDSDNQRGVPVTERGVNMKI